MGAGILIRGKLNPVLCNGKDVGKELRRVFGNPNSNPFKTAKGNMQAFLDVAPGGKYAGDSSKLYKAYTDSGVKACDSWEGYLGTLTSPVIQQIAAARYLGLSTDTPMVTGTHNPKNNGDHDVHVSTDLDDGTIMIDSPFTPG